MVETVHELSETMKILLTGATGFLGFRTLERLVEEPQVTSIVAVGRAIKPTHHVQHPKVQYSLGDLSNVLFVESLFDKVTHVVHAAALSSPWGHRTAFEQANAVTQHHLIASAQKAKISRYVYISTPSMYFELKDRFNVKESDPLPSQLINAYSETKRSAELELEQSNIPYITLRPRALTGRGDTVIMPRLIRAFDEGRLKIIGTGENVADLTSVSNVADAIWLSLIAEGDAVNEIYNITNGEPVKLWDSIADVLRKLGRTPPTKKIPFALVRFIAWIMERKSRMTDMREPALTVYGVGTLAKSLTLDISKAKKKLGYEPRLSTSEAIDEFVNWYKADEES